MYAVDPMENEETTDWKERYFQLLDKLAFFETKAEELEAKAEEFEAKAGALESKAKAFESETEALRQKNKALETKVKELEEKLNTNSRNSSKPPSQDPFRPKTPKKSSGRTQGAQPGHTGHKREMYSMDQVEKVVELRPNTCSGCGCSNFKEVRLSNSLSVKFEIYPY